MRKMALALLVLGAVALSSTVPGNAMKKMPSLQAPRQRGDGQIFSVWGPAPKCGLARRNREAQGHVGHCGNDRTMGLICQVRTVAGACLAGA
jgi:hypothetical protein